jgi:SAM-dependent methyltransferase
MNRPDLKQRLVDTAAERYRSAGRFAFHFARAKLAADPVFTALLARALIPDRARVLDLGCGQGLLAAWLLAAEACQQSGDWGTAWPQPPRAWCFRGIELEAREVDRANRALGTRASVGRGDIRSTEFGAADVVVILDVLHYMDPASQEAVLRRVRASLSQAGLLLLRIGDANGGPSFRVSNWVDRTVLMARGRGRQQLHCRPVPDWIELLDRLRLRTDAMPMSANATSANVLLLARPR